MYAYHLKWGNISSKKYMDMESIFASKYFLSKNMYHTCNGIFIDTKFVIFFYFEARKDS